MREFAYERATDVRDALIAAGDGARYLGGGTNLVDLMKEGVESPAWYYWVVGGVGGVAIVLASLIGVRELGAGGVTVAVIAGQLTASVVLDRLGVLGLEERAITWDKLLGIALLAVGTILIVRE